jgi:ankyrin repeat protein
MSAEDINEFKELMGPCDDEFAHACRFGNVGRVTAMLRARCPSSGRVPPLCYASRNAHAGVVRALLTERAAVNAQLSGRTALFYACAEPGIESAVSSIDGNVEVSVRSLDELKRRQLLVVRSLLKSRADPAIGASAVSLAVRNRNADVLRVLLRASASPNGKDESGTPALVDAAFNADVRCVKSLLAARADVNVLDTSVRVGATNAMIAATASVTEHPIENCLAVIDALLDAKADVNAHPWIVTPLAMAARLGSNRLLCKLLSRGARVNARGDGESTALHLACAAGHDECVASLVWHGADPNSVGDETPLFLCARVGSVRSVTTLLDSGAEVDGVSAVTSGAWVTALFISVEGSFYDVAKVLLERGASVAGTGKLGSPLTLAAYMGNVAFVELLLEARSDANDASAVHGERPLALAARSGSVHAVRLLLAHGAEIAAREDGSATALARAVREGHGAVARTLIKSGAVDATMAASEEQNESVQRVLRRYKCFFCRRIFATKLCRGCRMVSFCNAECQRRGYEAHAQECRRRAAADREALFDRTLSARGRMHHETHEALVLMVKAFVVRRVARYDDALAALKRHFEPLSEMSRTLPRLVCVAFMFTVLARSGRAFQAQLAYEMCFEMRDARVELLAAQGELTSESRWACVEIGEQLRGIAGSLEPEMRVAVLRSECELSVRLGIAAPRTILALARGLRVVGRAEEAAQMLECAAELAAMHHGPEHRVTRRIARLLSDQKGA